MLKLNQKIKIVPENIKDSTSGTITAINEEQIKVKLNSIKALESQNVEIYINEVNCLLCFKTQVTGQDNDTIMFPYPQHIQNIQRREYRRIEINLPIECQNNNENFQAESINISGGGIKLKTLKNIKSTKNISIKLPLGNGIKTDLEVLNTESLNDFFTASGWFKNINNTDRIYLIQYCFKKELELRCTGLGGYNH